LPLHDGEVAVEEGSSVANMLAPRQAARRQIANVTVLMELSLLQIFGVLLKMPQAGAGVTYNPCKFH
jgi:hypothetical protein